LRYLGPIVEDNYHAHPRRLPPQGSAGEWSASMNRQAAVRS